MIRQKDYQWEAAIKVAKEDGADYVAILLGRLRDAQKEIEALESAQQSAHADGKWDCPCGEADHINPEFTVCPACGLLRKV